MQIRIHRGSREIGGNCVEITAQGKRLIVDIGLPLDIEGSDPKYLPIIPGLDGQDDSLLAIVISHAHMDHFGLLKYVNDKVPVYMGKDARRIINAASPFLFGYSPVSSCGGDIENKKQIKIGPFSITPYLVDHAAYDSYSLLIEADGKRIFYTGDIRFHGRKGRLMETLMSDPPRDINVMMLEGTTVGDKKRNHINKSEKDIETELCDIFKAAKGMPLVHASGQNIDRIVTVFKAAKKSGRKLIIDLYDAVVLEATGNKNIPQSEWPDIELYVPLKQKNQIKRNQWFNLLKRHSAHRVFIENLKEKSEKSVMLFRPIHMKDLEDSGVIKNAVYIYSQWEGYWDKEQNAELRNWLEKHGIEKKSIHVSGHASEEDLLMYVEALKPERIVPIHTKCPERFSEIFKNAELHGDGEIWAV